MKIKLRYGKRLIFSILACIIALSLIPITPGVRAQSMKNQDSKVVGYYASWSAYSGFTPDKIDAAKLTHINYGFANIDDELRITLGDPYIDYINLGKFNELRLMNPQIKILISVGGWSWSDKFSDVALTDESRTIFAKSCVDFIKTYNLDGIDIDWEFPVSGGLPTNKARVEDKENFTLLLKDIREELDEQGEKDNRSYLLTIAGGAGSMGVDNLELWNIHNYIDFANIMTYDLHGVWDKYTDFSAPLYTNNDSPNYVRTSVDDAINSWVNAGFPKEKIVMGIPFNGKKYNDVNLSDNGLYQEYNGGSSIDYDNILSNYLYQPGFIRYFNWESLSPWLYNGTTFISYEDEVSIAYKADYINFNGLGGAMIWELSQDRNGILLDQLYRSLQY